MLCFRRLSTSHLFKRTIDLIKLLTTFCSGTVIQPFSLFIHIPVFMATTVRPVLNQNVRERVWKLSQQKLTIFFKCKFVWGHFGLWKAKAPLSFSQCRKGYADILVKSCHTKSLAAMKINEPCKKDVDAICKLLYLISQFHDKNFLYINGSSTT